MTRHTSCLSTHFERRAQAFWNGSPAEEYQEYLDGQELGDLDIPIWFVDNDYHPEQKLGWYVKICLEWLSPWAVRICHAQVLAIFFQRHLLDFAILVLTYKMCFGTKSFRQSLTSNSRCTRYSASTLQATSEEQVQDFGPETQSAQLEVSSPISDKREYMYLPHIRKAYLRKADMCSHQTGRSQNARRRQRNPQIEHRAAGKIEQSQCQSGSQSWPGQQLVLDFMKWSTWF